MLVVRGAAAEPPSLSSRTSITAAAPLIHLLLSSFPAIDGTLLTVYTYRDESVIDLADPASAAACFKVTRRDSTRQGGRCAGPVAAAAPCHS